MRRLILGFAAFVLPAVFSCDGTIAADRTTFVRELCEAYMACCGGDVDRCRAAHAASVGSAHYDERAARRCIQAMRAQSGQPRFCTDGVISPSCEHIFTGTEAVGAECKHDADCAPSAEGDVGCAEILQSGRPIAQKCQLRVDGRVGDTPCVGTRDGLFISYPYTAYEGLPLPTRAFVCDVSSGVFCEPTSRKCLALPRLGEACGAAPYPCGPDAACASGVCVARIPLDGACSGTNTNCARDAYCDPLSWRCRAKQANDAACTAFDECASGHCGAGKCDSVIGPVRELCDAAR